MVNNKVVRSTFALLALCGAVSACSSESGQPSNAAPALANDGMRILSQEVTQKASVKIASVTDSNGKPVALSAAPSLTRLREVNNAVVTKEAIEVGGEISQRVTIDLRGAAASVVKFQAETDMTALALASDFPATHAEAALAEGKISQLLVRLDEGRVVNVVLAFGVQQEQVKQAQEQVKQAQEQVKQAQQEQVKQAQEQIKQVQQEQVKQAQEQIKQVQQEQVKQAQEQIKQVKQEQVKFEQVKQAQEQIKQVKQEQVKFEQVKQAQEQIKQVQQEQVKQAQEQIKQVKQEQVKQAQEQVKQIK